MGLEYKETGSPYYPAGVTERDIDGPEVEEEKTVTEYIGDGVYAEFDGYGINLKTERETGEHQIYLEPTVWEALIKFVEREYGKEEEINHGS